MKSLAALALLTLSTLTFGGANDVAQATGPCSEIKIKGTYELRASGFKIGKLKFKKAGEQEFDVFPKVPLMVRILDETIAREVEKLRFASLSETEDECLMELGPKGNTDTFIISKTDDSEYILEDNTDSSNFMYLVK